MLLCSHLGRDLLRNVGLHLNIAERFPNQPDYLIRWLMNPQEMDPGNAMPTLACPRSSPSTWAPMCIRCRVVRLLPRTLTSEHHKIVIQEWPVHINVLKQFAPQTQPKRVLSIEALEKCSGIEYR
jgi:hypothetical protein